MCMGSCEGARIQLHWLQTLFQLLEITASPNLRPPSLRQCRCALKTHCPLDWVDRQVVKDRYAMRIFDQLVTKPFARSRDTVTL